MWTYVQKTGETIDDDGKVIAIGYSGAGVHKNDPDSQFLVNQGPAPRGMYSMLRPIDTETHGPYFIRLIPRADTEMHGRGGMAIHGDSITRPGTASNGCVIHTRAVREQIWKSGDHDWLVVAERKDVKGVDHSNLQGVTFGGHSD